jgi:hypothetical protein
MDELYSHRTAINIVGLLKACSRREKFIDVTVAPVAIEVIILGMVLAAVLKGMVM